MRSFFSHSAKVAVVGLLTALASGASLAAEERYVSLQYFGLHIHRSTEHGGWPSIPFGSWRLWDARVSWPHLEPTQGRWEFDMLDRYVAKATERGVELLLPLGLSPTWASSRPNEPSAYGSPGWAAVPKSMALWRDYVSKVAMRYKNRVQYYEIWNEPNLARFYSGTPEEMRALACDAYDVIKSVDPGAMLVSPAPTDKERGLAWLDEFLRLGGGRCVDIIGFHFYVYAHEPPELLDELIQQVFTIMSRYDMGRRPLWNTETGWYFANRGMEPQTRYRVQDHESSAAYVARALIIGAGRGLGRFYWYAWDNRRMGGLVEPLTGEPKPAAIAYSTVVRWLSGAAVSECGKRGEGVWVCGVVRDARQYGWLVWRPSGAEHTWQLPPDWNVRDLETLNGDRVPISGGRIDVGPSPVMLVAAPARLN